MSMSTSADEDAELEEMVQSLPDRRIIRAEEDEKRRAKLIPVQKPPDQLGSCWAFSAAGGKGGAPLNITEVVYPDGAELLANVPKVLLAQAQGGP